MGPRVVTALDAAKALKLMGRKEPPMACCTSCKPDEPLVMTFERRGYEFTCMKCGGWFGFLDPKPITSTPELEALLKKRQAEHAAREAKS